MPKIHMLDGQPYTSKNGNLTPYNPAPPRRLTLQETALDALYSADLRMSQLEAILLRDNGGNEHSIKSTLTQMRAKGHIAFRKSVQRRCEDQVVVIAPEGERLEEARRARSLIMPPGVSFDAPRANPNYRGNHSAVNREWVLNALRSNASGLSFDQLLTLATEQGKPNVGALNWVLDHLVSRKLARLRDDSCYVLIAGA